MCLNQVTTSIGLAKLKTQQSLFFCKLTKLIIYVLHELFSHISEAHYTNDDVLN